MRWIGIETSCDESAAALVEVTGGSLRVAASLVGSQIAQHRPYGGVVPEVAVREHLRNLPRLVPAALAEAGWKAGEIAGVAVTRGPGLATSLLIGHGYARGLALALGKPVRGINHLEGHLLSPFFAENKPVAFPFLGLVVSGGHTLLIEARGWNDYRKLGGTVDDAAGEVFDKVARMLGLGYPGGPEIEKAARAGDPAAYDFPQAFPERDSFQFSFSGLKTSVRYFLEKHPGREGDSPTSPRRSSAPSSRCWCGRRSVPPGRAACASSPWRAASPATACCAPRWNGRAARPGWSSPPRRPSSAPTTPR
jgi:N6-L-threonylcarbamoyladenine synthase